MTATFASGEGEVMFHEDRSSPCLRFIRMHRNLEGCVQDAIMVSLYSKTSSSRSLIMRWSIEFPHHLCSWPLSRVHRLSCLVDHAKFANIGTLIMVSSRIIPPSTRSECRRRDHSYMVRVLLDSSDPIPEASRVDLWDMP